MVLLTLMVLLGLQLDVEMMFLVPPLMLEVGIVIELMIELGIMLLPMLMLLLLIIVKETMPVGTAGSNDDVHEENNTDGSEGSDVDGNEICTKARKRKGYGSKKGS